MFKKALTESLSKIFVVDDVTFDAPQKETREQNVLYIDVVSATTNAQHGSVSGIVKGDIYMYAPNDKLTFGYFNKAIHRANKDDPAVTQPFFFHQMDQSGEYYGNLVERRCSFEYQYNVQYDPEAGRITDIVIDPMDGEIDQAYEEAQA